MESTRLKVAEIFRSVQGEGGLVGMPSTFLRLSGCNLRCVWCDTPYASWTPEGTSMSIVEILDQVQDRHVVLTGGEPMIFDAVEALSKGLREKGRHITIETAGTVFRNLECDLMSISPKLSNSTPFGRASEEWIERHEQRRKDLAPLRKLIESYNFQLKFVVNPETGEDMREVEAVLEQLGAVDPAQVLLMAEGTTSEIQHRRQKALVEVSLRTGWRLTPRMHIDLFGNERGT